MVALRSVVTVVHEPSNTPQALKNEDEAFFAIRSVTMLHCSCCTDAHADRFGRGVE